MKASTLFVISISLLVALVGLYGAKTMGLFDKNKAVAETRVKEDPVLVLVANSDLYKGIAIGPGDVRVRELYPSEREFFRQNDAKLLPAFVSAATLKIPERAIRADQILTRDLFKEDQPEAIGRRVEFGMRAVTVSVPKERCAGGVIQLGESVDVWLTSRMTLNDQGNEKTVTRTACLARECRVIMKRNNLRTLLASDSGDVSFTLQANPYRAALIEFGQYKGMLSLIPVPSDPTVIELDPRRRNEGMAPMTYGDMNSIEYRDEDARVNKIRNGDLVVGDTDLERIFDAKPIPKIPPIVIPIVSGINRAGSQVFSGDAPAYRQVSTTPASGGGGGATFNQPGDDPTKKECKNCGSKKKAETNDQFQPLPSKP